MPEIVVRGLSSETVQRLKKRAKRNGRSLQSELKLLLERAAGEEDLGAILDRWKRKFAGRRFSSTVAIVRRDRGR